MTEWSLNAEQRRGELKVRDELVIANVAALREDLLRAFAEADQVTIDVSEVADIDVAGLQMLCACQVFASGQQKGLSLATGDNQVFLDFVEESGLADGDFGGLLDPALNKV